MRYVIADDAVFDEGGAFLEIHGAALGRGPEGPVVVEHAIGDLRGAPIAVDTGPIAAGLVVADDAEGDGGRGVLTTDATAVFGHAPTDGEACQDAVAAFAVGERHDGALLRQADDEGGLGIDVRVRGVRHVAAAQRDGLALEVDKLAIDGVAVGLALGDEGVAVHGVVDGRLDRGIDVGGITRVDDPAGGPLREGVQRLGDVEPPVGQAQARHDLVGRLQQRMLDVIRG